MFLSMVVYYIRYVATLVVNNQALEEVDSLTYLGRVVNNLSGSDKDMKIRLSTARTAVNMMESI